MCPGTVLGGSYTVNRTGREIPARVELPFQCKETGFKRTTLNNVISYSDEIL